MKFSKRAKAFPGFYIHLSAHEMTSYSGAQDSGIYFSKRARSAGTTYEPLQAIPHSLIQAEHAVSEQILLEDEPQETNCTNSLTGLHASLHEAYTEKMRLRKEIMQIQKEIASAELTSLIMRTLIIGFLTDTFSDKIKKKKAYCSDLEWQFMIAVVKIDLHLDRSVENNYINLLSAYRGLLTSEQIWDITASFPPGRKNVTGAASLMATRVPVYFTLTGIDIIQSSYAAFHLENKNGGDLYIYPSFAIVTNKERFRLIDLKDLHINFASQRFTEEDRVPSDTNIVDKTWARVNKDGQPDRRFAHNYEIPVVRYGMINISSDDGLNETYAFSNHDHAAAFAAAFKMYKKMLQNASTEM